MINAKNVSVELNGTSILENINCYIPLGEVTVLMGKNGAGKSTLLRALSGEIPATSGRVSINNLPINRISAKQLANQRAVLTQSVHLSYTLSVKEVVEIGCYNRYQQLTAKERERLIASILERLQLSSFKNRSFYTLSGGEQKRVLLAKCLIQLEVGKSVAPQQFLLLDEPTAALDIEQQYFFMELVTELTKERGIGVLAVLHDLNLAARFADLVTLLKEGQCGAIGTVEEVFTPMLIREIFAVDCLVQPHPHFNIPLITTYGKYQTTTTRASVTQGSRATVA